jgi:hypothetical protein
MLKKNKRVNALKDVKRLFKEFQFTAGLFKDTLSEDRELK